MRNAGALFPLDPHDDTLGLRSASDEALASIALARPAGRGRLEPHRGDQPSDEERPLGAHDARITGTRRIRDRDLRKLVEAWDELRVIEEARDELSYRL